MSEQYTLLQTDVVDSTQLNARLGDEVMAEIWEAHDRVSRDLLRSWRGRELDRSDGFLLQFATPSDAVGYALEYHRGLAALRVPLKARAGLHVGPVTTRENQSADVTLGAKPFEVVGMAIPTTARVMSLAQGGKTLRTREAKVALGATALRLESHGYWRAKGLEEPIELFEVGDADAPFAPPPDAPKVYRVVRHGELWLPLAQVRHSLPAERDPFFGRKEPLQELARRIDAGSRLISVLGIGGAGKTRFVQRFGWTWLGDFSSGVWFFDLSQARSLDGIVYAVAQGLDVPLGRADPVSQLGAALAGRGPCLVILDNFEQVSRYAEQTLGQWLGRAREARFIVTTREVLGVAGEEMLALAPMRPNEGAALFRQRAAAAADDYHPTAEDETAIGPLVRLLDGLPLAIELAAARVRVIPPRMLLQRMSDRFTLLASSGGRADRQATLRGTFDWSWDLLSLPDKTALAQLSVFEGGFTLDAAEVFLDLSACGDAPPPLNVLQSLVEKSLVRKLSDQRFDLLGTVQEYAAEHLRTEGRFAGSGTAALAAAQGRHWQHFSGLGEVAAIADGWVEVDNLVAACRRAAVQGDAPAAVAALAGAWAALKLCGPFRGGVALAALVRKTAGLRPGDQAMVEWVAGNALNMMGRIAEARVCYDNGLALARAAGSPHSEARMLCAIGEQLTAAGEIEDARTHLMRASTLARALDDRSLQCVIFNALGALFHGLAQLDEARSNYEAALGLARELGDLRWEGGLLGNLGGLLYGHGQLDEAREHYEQALALARRTGDRRWEGNTRSNLGLLCHEQGRSDEARSHFEVALAMAREMGHARLECTVLCNLGIVIEAQGELGAACDHYDKAVAAARELGDRRSEGQFRSYLGRTYARLGRLREAQDCLSVGESLLLDVSDRLSLGLLLCNLAEVEMLGANAKAAQIAFQRSEALARETDAGPESELGRALRQVRVLLAQSSKA